MREIDHRGDRIPRKNKAPFGSRPADARPACRRQLLLDVSVRTIYNMLALGQLKGYKVGGTAIRIEGEDLDALLASGLPPGAAVSGSRRLVPIFPRHAMCSAASGAAPSTT